LWSNESAEAHVVLGQAYLQLRDAAAARAEAERALALVPTSTEARRILEQAKP
jgi:Tfp pilus assembly protein PilF